MEVAFVQVLCRRTNKPTNSSIGMGWTRGVETAAWGEGPHLNSPITDQTTDQPTNQLLASGMMYTAWKAPSLPGPPVMVWFSLGSAKVSQLLLVGKGMKQK